MDEAKDGADEIVSIEELRERLLLGSQRAISASLTMQDPELLASLLHAGSVAFAAATSLGENGAQAQDMRRRRRREERR